MDTTGTVTTSTPEAPAARRIPRAMLTAALACFTLPFLTVTCYGDDVTVSGVQAATTVDITSQAEPDPGDRQFAQEGEPPNLFALLALVATVLGVVLSFGSAALRRATVWTASLAAIALVGFFLYAYYRTTGHAVPEVGLPAAIALLVGAAWAAMGAVPRWVVWAISTLAVAMIPYTLFGTDTQAESAIGFLPFYAGAFASVVLALGAVRASFDPGALRIGRRPSASRIVVAGLVAVVCLGAVGVGAPLYLGGLVGGFDTTIGGSYGFAALVLGTFAGTSALVWLAARRILRGRAASGGARLAVPDMPGP